MPTPPFDPDNCAPFDVSFEVGSICVATEQEAIAAALTVLREALNAGELPLLVSQPDLDDDKHEVTAVFNPVLVLEPSHSTPGSSGTTDENGRMQWTVNPDPKAVRQGLT